MSEVDETVHLKSKIVSQQ